MDIFENVIKGENNKENEMEQRSAGSEEYYSREYNYNVWLDWNSLTFTFPFVLVFSVYLTRENNIFTYLCSRINVLQEEAT
jgi:hypothetical protein